MCVSVEGDVLCMVRNGGCCGLGTWVDVVWCGCGVWWGLWGEKWMMDVKIVWS